MLSMHFNIAESAKKTPAQIARHGSPALRVIKAGGILRRDHRLGGFPLSNRPVEGGEHNPFQRLVAAGTRLGSAERR